jgi:pyruvate,water dikinase
VPLAGAAHETTFGGKAVSLGAAMRAGLPVPPGIALSAAVVDRIAAGDPDAVSAIRDVPDLPSGRLAVRSSAVGEDSHGASFAGQHATRLNVTSPGLLDAVRTVWASARSDSALAYRRRRGIRGEPAIGAVVQQLVEPVAAGVLFTRNPVTGADERVIEAAWGLGEAVVSGRVVPDRFRLGPDGRILEAVPGDKDVRIWFGEGDGTVELPVEGPRRAAPCLEPEHLSQLHGLADRCLAAWGSHVDLEWALGPDGRVFLLQSRPITGLRLGSA